MPKERNLGMDHHGSPFSPDGAQGLLNHFMALEEIMPFFH